ncbi:MAG: esterase/lipase family protein [Pirellulaceae bacterium]
MPLERRIGRSGFRTLNWGYRSITGEIGRLSGVLATLLRELDERTDVNRYHLVTHSMGCILARAALGTSAPARLGSVVMLAPPNRGSTVATRLAPVLGWLCKPLIQLADGEDSFVNSLPVPQGLRIGVIAAAHDRMIRIADTVLTTQADHIVVPSGHTSMLFRPDVAALVAGFLRDGRFPRQPAA